MPLPEDILLSRLKNELFMCSRYLKDLELPQRERFSFPLEVIIELNRVPALVMRSECLERRYEHRFKIVISRSYPFEKPKVVWLTPIFHPNIMMPEDGGFLCTKLMEGWSFNSTLGSFIKGIESLLLNPNPESPFGTESCTAAAQYFNSGEKKVPPLVCCPSPKVVRSP